MNASRIDNLTLQLEMNNAISITTTSSTGTETTSANGRGACNVRIYAMNHNVLRIVDGFGGLLFRV